ncbi:class I SAM-dependent methyltransferase [Methanolobus mangrovi]|uniref:Class I SAM-dependent methyltransferase n=1 Tax=Methanolobus mangrovi TaxID=3072977 RepID=A0AA51UJ98_9EURY|nr:class I SAM-dependent methyltransferase [Methanolobus mangrovi]WMW23137.1 class I SAM-dependent methyltransferase [Methanolobus mangrovi]
MSFKPIGKVSNFADEKTMQLLALWKESVSVVELDETDAEAYLYEDYSHYIVIHDPLKMEFPEKRKEWNRRFCRDASVSVVELIKVNENKIYFKGLFAINESSIYGIVPYTSFDNYEADFPVAEMEILKKQTMDVALPQATGKTILDVGCGVGSITLQMARMNPLSQVMGIDLMEETMEQCQLNAAAYDVTNASFKAASVYELPFEKGDFETITCFFMLHHLDDIPKALSEVKRVLATGGKVLAVEPLDHNHGTERRIQDWVDQFENAGFSVETEQISRAVFVQAMLK